MDKKYEISEITRLSQDVLQGLSILPIDVVNGGASVGFLPPLSLEDSKNYWNEVLGEGIILWTLRLEGDIVGTIQLHLCQKQNGLHRAEVAKLMIHSKARRRGIGRTLLNLAEERARIENRTLITLDTRALDVSNILYKSNGYVESGRIPRYDKSANGELHETIFYYKFL